jgi:hypothetical protein
MSVTWEEVRITHVRNRLRQQFDGKEVEVIVKDSGLQHTYRGTLYFGTGNEDSVMVGLDEIMLDCITSVKGL